MKTIYLLRHGRTIIENNRRYLGRREVGLSSTGREQITHAAPYLANREINAVYCSPLGRCLESATILARHLNLPVETERNLAEIDLGTWDGQEISAIRQKFPTEYAARGKNFADFRPPGGENFRDLLTRVWPSFVKIAQTPGEAAAIVAHAGVNRVIISKISGLDLNKIFEIKQKYGCINIFDYTGDHFYCRELNVLPFQKK